MKNLFILSLPRSGSTLVQKYLSRHRACRTLSEPWILLPLFYMFKQNKIFSEYEHHLFNRAYNDLELQGFDKEEIRKRVLRSAAHAYYDSVHLNGKIFIDKTPRYSTICEEIYEVFPDEFYLVLLRHPLACVQSMLKTFGGGAWCMYRFEVDLFLGLPKLASFIKKFGRACNVQTLKYEEFVEDPETSYARVCSMLGLAPEDRNDFDEKSLKGTLGDPTGANKFGGRVDNRNGAAQWSCTFNTFYRRRWAKKFLGTLGRQTFDILGYDYEDTMEKLGKGGYSLRQELLDIPHIALTAIHRCTGIYVSWAKLREKRGGRRVFGMR